MEFTEAVRRRRMVRRYRPDPVPEQVVHALLDTARRAPSAGFSQGQSFVVVTDRDQRARIAAACGEDEWVRRGYPAWLSVAPVHVVVCVRRRDYELRYAQPDKAGSRPPREWDVPYEWVDGGAALMLLLLAATDAGLGAGLLAPPDPDALRELLGIPADVGLLGLVTLGHPHLRGPTESAGRKRRAFAEVVHQGRWRA